MFDSFSSRPQNHFFLFAILGTKIVPGGSEQVILSISAPGAKIDPSGSEMRITIMSTPGPKHVPDWSAHLLLEHIQF